MNDIALEILEIAEDINFVSRAISSPLRARELRGYVARLTELSRRLDEESK